MNTKMKKCKVCQADIAASAKICPQCGAKNSKPIFKKWWFWTVVIIAAVIIIFSGGDSEEATNNNPQTTVSDSTASNSQNTTSETTQANTESSSPANLYKWIAENSEEPFTISEKSITFMNEHQNFFPGDSNIKGAISDFVDEEITYAHLSKSMSKYGDKLIAIEGDVVDIEEINDGELTYLHILDYDYNSYTLYYLGSLDDVFEETSVLVYALPLTMTTFENMSAQYTEAVLGAACYVDVLY